MPVSNRVMGKRHKRENLYQDRISQLPDDILVSIISLLSITELARTSILSRRWKKLWTLTTGSLHFDPPKQWWFTETSKFWKPNYIRYVQWVNQILDSHHGSTISGLQVCFNLTKEFQADIDRWIEVAMLKKVQTLELKLSPIIVPGNYHNYYTLQQHCFNRVMNQLDSSHIMPLRSLYLDRVNVNQDMVEFVLSNCPLLERISIGHSAHLVNLKVAGSSLRLKYLEISPCPCLQLVEVSAPNLVLFKYHGTQTVLDLKSMPLLCEVSFSGLLCSPVGYTFRQLSSCLSQLETLKLEIEPVLGILQFPQFPGLPNLRHLTWVVSCDSDISLLDFIPLIEACPFLCTFTLYLTTDRAQREMKVRKAKYRNKHLKVVKIVGFVGCAIDVELAMYFLESAVKLEKFIADSRSMYDKYLPYHDADDCRDKMTEGRKNAKESAWQLEKQLPPGAKLVVI